MDGDWVIYAARAKASGANVHEVNNLCTQYVLFKALSADDPTYVGEARRIEELLHAMARTGKLPEPPVGTRHGSTEATAKKPPENAQHRPPRQHR